MGMVAAARCRDRRDLITLPQHNPVYGRVDFEGLATFRLTLSLSSLSRLPLSPPRSGGCEGARLPAADW